MLKLKNDKIFKIIKFHFIENVKFILFFAFILFIINFAALYWTFKYGDKNSIFSITQINTDREDTKSQNVSLNIIYFFIGFGPATLFASILISAFMTNKLFSNEFKTGKISFWMSMNLKRIKIYFAKYILIQIVSIIIFIPIMLLYIIFGTFAIDSENYVYIIFNLSIFLLTIILLNSLIIFINIICKQNILLFFMIIGIFGLFIFSSGIGYEMYKTDESLKVFSYNKYFSMNLIMPAFLHSSLEIYKVKNINSDFIASFRKIETPKNIEIYYMLLVQIILLSSQTLLSAIIWNKQDFKNI